MLKIYKHENGYTAVLYGESSLSVVYDGKEVLHSGSCNIKSEEEVMRFHEEMPDFVKKFEQFLKK